MPLIRCPSCAKTLRVPDQLARATVRCSGCGHKMTLGTGSGAAAQRDAPPPIPFQVESSAPSVHASPSVDRDSKRRARRDPDGATGRRRKKGAGPSGLIVLYVVVPIGLILTVLTFFSGYAYNAAMVVGCGSMMATGWAIDGAMRKYGYSDDNHAYLAVHPHGLYYWGILTLFGLFVVIVSTIIFGLVRPPPYPLSWKSRSAESPPIPVMPIPKVPERQVAKVTGVAELDDALADLASPQGMNQGLEKLVRLVPDDYTDAQGAQVAARVARLVNVEDPFGNSLLIKVLGVWATPDELPILIRALDSKNHWMREEALKHVAKFRDEKALPAVVRCLDEGLLRHQAGETLRQMGRTMPREVEKVVLPNLTHPDIFRRKDTISLLKDFGTERSIPALQALADSNEAFINDSVQEALAAIRARARK